MIERIVLQLAKTPTRYQMVFVHLPLQMRSEASSTVEMWRALRHVLRNDGSLWICANNSRGSIHDPWPLQLAAELQNSDFFVRNIILWYNKEYEAVSSLFINRYSYLIFATAGSDYLFHLDAVREPHIWKDFEWGGGRRSRYNPLGKNPSNFWIHVNSSKGKTIGHVPLSWDEMVERCVRVSTNPDSAVLGIIPERRDFAGVAHRLGVLAECLNLEAEVMPQTAAVLWKTKRVEEEHQPVKHFTPEVHYKSSENMSELGDTSVQLAVTSPPYWGLRDYGVNNQIGFGEGYDQYLDRLEKVWGETYRVLRTDGTFWLNINKRLIAGRMLLIPADIADGRRSSATSNPPC